MECGLFQRVKKKENGQKAALLAAYMINRGDNETLEEYLSQKVFVEKAGMNISPNLKDVEGFEQFMKRYTEGLAIERAAIDFLK